MNDNERKQSGNILVSELKQDCEEFETNRKKIRNMAIVILSIAIVSTILFLIIEVLKT